MVIDDDTLVHRRVTKELYPNVAKKHKSTTTLVERAIRTCIETAYDRGNLELLNEMFGYSISPSKGKATNCEFIATVAEYIKETYGG